MSLQYCTTVIEGKINKADTSYRASRFKCLCATVTKKLVSATLTGVAIFIFLLRAVFPSARNRQGDTSKMGNPITEWIRSTMEDQDTNRAKNAQNVAL